MRILIGAVGHESNTFTPFLTTMDDFTIRYGEALFQDSSRRGSLAGIIETLRGRGAELAPTVAAWAMPGGVVERGAYETFKQAILEQAHDVDGVCLALHGAMRAEGLDYAEADLLRDLRAGLGLDVPITLALDMHANIIGGLAANAGLPDRALAGHQPPLYPGPQPRRHRLRPDPAGVPPRAPPHLPAGPGDGLGTWGPFALSRNEDKNLARSRRITIRRTGADPPSRHRGQSAPSRGLFSEKIR